MSNKNVRNDQSMYSFLNFVIERFDGDFDSSPVTLKPFLSGAGRLTSSKSSKDWYIGLTFSIGYASSDQPANVHRLSKRGAVVSDLERVAKLSVKGDDSFSFSKSGPFAFSVQRVYGGGERNQFHEDYRALSNDLPKLS